MNRLVVRKNKSLNRDVGLKKTFLQILLSYNPLWLRIGLETVFGEIIYIEHSDLAVSLSRFVMARLLTSPVIEAEFAHPSVPHHYGAGFEEALKMHTLKKFLQLVYFLDKAKGFRLIKHDPCLFCKDSHIKMSKDVIVEFSKDFLQGEGNVIKHLNYLGYELTHKQTALDEFDFAVTNIAVDLRDGVRLW